MEPGGSWFRDRGAAMSFAPDDFRHVMGRLAGGVAIVTASDAGEPRGLTATAICSVSLEPPLVLACIGQEAHTLAAVRASGRYALNFLVSADRARADRFARAAGEKFDGMEWIPAPGGSPLLTGSLAWAECQVEQEVEAGDHAIFIGRVTHARVELPDASPLVYFGGRYHTVTVIEE